MRSAIARPRATAPVTILHLGKGDQRSLSFTHRAAREGVSAIALIKTIVTHARILWLITLRGRASARDSARPPIMTSTLLHACLRDCRRRELQYVALTFSPGMALSQKRKHALIDDIEMHASSSEGNHEAVCRFLLSMLTKAVIDAHIRSASG